MGKMAKNSSMHLAQKQDVLYMRNLFSDGYMQLMSESVIGGEKAILSSPERIVSADTCLKFYYMAKHEADRNNPMVSTFHSTFVFRAKIVLAFL